MTTTDVIVVGSGPGGVHAAAALVESGRSVRLLDYGNEDDRYAAGIPERPFPELRRTDPEQHRYLLGDAFEGIALGGVRVGAQLTPPRMHVFADADTWVPIESGGFAASASLAKGGFGAAWGAGAFPFDAEELAATSLALSDLQPHYDAVAERIGVCGDRDDLDRFFPSSPSMMPAPEIDSNAEAVLARYGRKRAALHAAGFRLGAVRAAMATQEHRGRGPHRYLDLAYWSDADRSIWRPRFTLAELERSERFQYVGRRFVGSFEEREGRVRVHHRHADSGEEATDEAGAVVLAAGTFGTARIVLRSLARYGERVPILCNPYSYAPMLNLGTFGRPVRDRRHSLAQLVGVLSAETPHRHRVQAQVFSYRSLLTFKLMKELPFAQRESLRIMRSLVPYLTILGIHHEDRPTEAKRCWLERGAGEGAPDRLRVDYRPDEAELRVQRADERRLLRVFTRLSCIPLRMVRPGDGANIHYAGTFPMHEHERDLTCDPEGRLRGTRAVYLADGSVFPWLPAKGLTFTLMANANRVGARLAERLA